MKLLDMELHTTIHQVGQMSVTDGSEGAESAEEMKPPWVDQSDRDD